MKVVCVKQNFIYDFELMRRYLEGNKIPKKVLRKFDQLRYQEEYESIYRLVNKYIVSHK